MEALLRELGIKQILEFASGISLRGLAMTEDPMVNYVETDLPALTEEKHEILRKIMQKYGIMRRQNLHIFSANILNEREIERVLPVFRLREPVAIVHEGLFPYLNRNERRIAACNIRRVLNRLGGVWITPDLDAKVDLIHNASDGAAKPIVDQISLVTGCNVTENAFADDDEMVDFFTREGFEIEAQPMLSARTELSLYRDRPMPEEIRVALKSLRLWVMRVAPKVPGND